MDPISREPSPSYLPIAGLIAGLVGLLLGGIALANASKANTAALEAQAAQATYQQRIDGFQATYQQRIDGFESSLSSTQSTAEGARSSSTKLVGEVNSAFQQVASEMAKINTEIAKLQEVATRSAVTPARAAAASAGPAVAGPGEYVVKGGDTGFKIASSNGMSVTDLQAVNPGVNWNSLKVGQKLKLPKK